jgi:XRE family transcriptional regulator, thiamine biosynthesis regulator
MQETPQELAARAILPALRGMVARDLVREHRFTHQRAADLLGLSRPAVTLYARGLRGRAIELRRKEDVQLIVRDMANGLARGELDTRGLMTKLDAAATYILRKGYACKLHELVDPDLKGSGCNLCMTTDISCTYFRPWKTEMKPGPS